MKKTLQIIIILIMILFIGLIFNNNSVCAYTNEEYAQKLEESVSYAMSLIDDKMTDHEKAFIFAQYCQEGNKYSVKSPGQTAECVLVDHVAVCAGYANAFKLLCTTAGIPCETMISYSANHEWAICYLDGEWSYFDVTRGSSGNYAPQGFSVTGFATKDKFGMVYVRDNNNNEFWSDAEYAKKQGYTIIKTRYFEDAYYSGGGLNSNYYPEGTEWKMDNIKFSLTTSRVYYDDNYRYYGTSKFGDTTTKIYKENRTTNERTELTESFLYDGTNSGLVKDNNKLYYVSTDGKTIYSMDLNGNNKTQEFKYTGSATLSGIFVQDGYIYYVTRTSTSDTTSTWTKWRKLETGVKTGTYTINDAKHKYELNYIQTSKGITISSCTGIGGAEPSGELYIPETINGVPVTRIGAQAFCEVNLTGELTLPKNVKSIGKYSFSKSKISKIIFNDNLQSIGYGAFYYCEKLTGTLDMSNKVTYVGNLAFSECDYNKINLSNNLKMIGTSAFSWNRTLTGVQKIPEGVVTIGEKAFYYTSLESAIVPTTLENLGKEAFRTINKKTFESVAIKSNKMKSFYGSQDYDIYLNSGTETATYANNENITYKDLQTVTPNVELSETEISLQEGGEPKQLNYTITPKFLEESDLKINWSSSDTKVVTVNQTGKITPVKAGSANIYLTVNNKQTTCTVTVANPYKKGDTNKDGTVTIYDVIQILNQAVLGGDLSEDMLYIMDYNEDGKVTLYDAIQFLNIAILG